MNKLEILAPVGGVESLYPAVRAGADAVYLGAKKLSARSSARNFNREELKGAIDYCHTRGVKVYLACNTLIHDSELCDAMKIVEYACSLPVDALIVQDLGLISLIRKFAPDMRLHASTQMSVHTPAGVEMLYNMGFKRAVLSRELSKDEIAEIASKSKIELEVFVHGALCMSVSGQCYFSAMLGSRSGNRGACAQPCRLPFGVNGGTGYDLSLKDVSIIDRLRELQEMGIKSAKIEGRMKRPEYVAVSVAACRSSLDSGSVDSNLSEKLKAVFSRSGFTDGYYTGKRGVQMFGIRSKENVTSATSKIFNSIHTIYKDEVQRVPIDFELTVKGGKETILMARDNENHTAVFSGQIPEQAIKIELSEDRCRSYISKTGGTPFYMRNFICNLDKGLSLPSIALNSLRRDCLDSILNQRKYRKPVNFSEVTYPKTLTRKNIKPKNFRARFTDCNIPDEFLDSELIYVPINLKDEEYVYLLDRGFALAVEIPRGMFGIEKYIYERLKRIQSLGINEVLASNIGAIQTAKNLSMDIHGGFGLNIMNTASIEWAESMGLMDVEVSFEMTLQQISELGGRLPIGIVSYGRLPLMLTRNCPVQNDGQGCKSCKKTRTLKDRKNIEFPVQCYGSCSEILNSVPVILSDRKNEICGVNFEVLRFSVENSVEIGENLQSFNRKSPTKGGFTRGLYYRGVE